MHVFDFKGRDVGGSVEEEGLTVPAVATGGAPADFSGFEECYVELFVCGLGGGEAGVGG